MYVLVTVPFKERHMDLIRQAAGEGSTVVQLVDENPGRAWGPGGNPYEARLREELTRADVVVGEPPLKMLREQDVAAKLVQMTWAGTDMYTRVNKRFPDGVALANVAGEAYGHTISQYVVGQILALTQNLATYVRQQQTMAWRDAGPNRSLEGATVLIFGAGDIGSHVAKRLQGFDCARIVGVCRNSTRPRDYFDDLVTLPRAETLLPVADVVVGCLPNVPETAGYFSERRLRLIRPGGVLVNVGRGNFVDCDALVRVLNDGHLRGAALDVTDPEPLPLNHALWRNPRAVVTPHISGGAFGHSDGTEDRICDVCCRNLRHFAAGEPLEHRVL